MSFENLGLSDEVLRAVKAIGFENPTPIQEKTIPEILKGNKDLIGLAQTGTGKTASFGLPMIELTDFAVKKVQGLVICPTRELCIQISNDFNNFTRFIKGAEIVSVYGGAGIVKQMSSLKKGAHIVVATPGRLHDLIRRKAVDLSNVKYVVLDEADEMMSMGFKEDLDIILNQTPKEKRTWLFSATMPAEVSRIADNYMDSPVEIIAGKKNSLAQNIEHLCYCVREKNRYEALKRVIDFYPDIYGLIFCRTRNETGEVAEKLIRDGYNAEALHGDLSQMQRDAVMKSFRSKTLDFLVATDVAARGIDIDDVTHVINYNLPDDVEAYTHRSGRTARAGKSGISIAIITPAEKRKLAAVENRTKVSFRQEKVPSGSLVCEKQLFALVDRFKNVDVDKDAIANFIEPAYEKLKKLTKNEIIERFISMEFNRFLDYYKNAEDINISDAPQKRKASSKQAYTGNMKYKGGKTSRLFIGAGKLDNLNKGAIIRLVCDNAGIKSNHIKKIDVLREFSFFEVESGYADVVISSMKNVNFDGKKVSVSMSKSRRN
ncbi:MAG: DEAD/DEAH box helicase [Desulfobacteraceae bacterium]|nr:DEAD/DEAH box helicase [Desulfobacteraceae bacterium]MCB9495071.1 DEAD/DEAH box helicase [Desulfobacteraceae bacterium]